MTVALTVAQLVVVVSSLAYLARQVRGERVASGFAAYSHINDTYMEHLRRANDEPNLNTVWDPLDVERKREFDLAQESAKVWGAWHTMTDAERRCYRFTRAALEIIEQAWEAQRHGLIGGDTWCKWEKGLEIWTTSSYFPYVLADSTPRLIPGFVVKLEEARAAAARSDAKPRTNSLVPPSTDQSAPTT